MPDIKLTRDEQVGRGAPKTKVQPSPRPVERTTMPSTTDTSTGKSTPQTQKRSSFDTNRTPPAKVLRDKQMEELDI